MRIFIGILVGLAAAIGVQVAFDVVANMFYPVAITDMWDRAQVSEAFAARPTGALALTVASYFVAAMAGSFIARQISRRNWTVWVPAGVLALMALIIVATYPLPAWAWIGALVAPLIGGFAARHIGRIDEPAAAGEPDAGL